MSRRIWAAVLICAALAGAAALFRQDAEETMAAEQLRGILCPVRLVLDAGHGGEDGGAVSLTGVPESRINLAIALRLEDILAFCGLPPQLFAVRIFPFIATALQRLERKRSPTCTTG